MYRSNMSPSIEEEGDLHKKAPKEHRELTSFYGLVIDETTKEIASNLISTDIKCFRMHCEGKIQSVILKETDEIHWECSECQNEGTISGWQKTQWDNR